MSSSLTETQLLVLYTVLTTAPLTFNFVTIVQLFYRFGLKFNNLTSILRLINVVFGILHLITNLSTEFVPPFSCIPLIFEFVCYGIDQLSFDCLLLIRIFALNPSRWVKVGYIFWLILMTLIVIISICLAKLVFAPSGVCISILFRETGLALVIIEMLFYSIIGIHFSYGVSNLMRTNKEDSFRMKRLALISNILFIFVILFRLSFYLPFYYEVLGVFTISLLSFMTGVETWVLNLSFDLLADHSKSSSNTSTTSVSSKTPVRSNKMDASSIA